MIDLTNIKDVRILQGQIQTVFDSPQGREVMKFLEESCGWYESVFDPIDKDRVLINAGRREVLATLKTLLEHPPEHIVAMAQQKEMG